MGLFTKGIRISKSWYGSQWYMSLDKCNMHPRITGRQSQTLRYSSSKNKLSQFWFFFSESVPTFQFWIPHVMGGAQYSCIDSSWRFYWRTTLITVRPLQLSDCVVCESVLLYVFYSCTADRITTISHEVLRATCNWGGRFHFVSAMDVVDQLP